MHYSVSKRKRERFSWSLTHKLLFSNAISIIIPLFLFGIIFNIISSQILLDKISKSNTDMLIQLGNHIDSTINDIDSISLLIVMQDEISELWRLNPRVNQVRYQILERKITDMITYLKTSKSFISTIHLEYNNGRQINELRDIVTNQLVSIFTESEKAVLAAANGGGLWFIKSNYAEIPGQSLSFGRCVKDFRNLITRIGYVEICIDEDVFTDIYRRSQNVLDGDFYLLDKNRIVLSSTDKKSLGNQLYDAAFDFNVIQEAKGYYFKKINNIKYLVSYYKTLQEDWLLLNIVNTEKLLQDNRIITSIMICGVLLAFIICMFTMGYSSNQVLNPLKALKEGMFCFEKGNFNTLIIASGHDEISEIGESFNKMVIQLKQTMDKLCLSELSQKKSELSVLQSQINPHFLYNTLDTIYWISREEKAPQSAELIKALSVLFRMSLNNGRQFCTVREEVEFIGNYFTIQSKRYENVIDFKMEVEETLLDYSVVSMILQPLVENSINHGMRQTKSGGYIKILIREEQGNLVYRVIDNGVGTDKEYVQKILNDKTNKEGFALRNVDQRIKLCYGNSYGLEFHSDHNHGTEVIITQPLQIVQI
jgi:two-component system sensor histidine kinase YesM